MLLHRWHQRQLALFRPSLELCERLFRLSLVFSVPLVLVFRGHRRGHPWKGLVCLSLRNSWVWVSRLILWVFGEVATVFVVVVVVVVGVVLVAGIEILPIAAARERRRLERIATMKARDRLGPP